MQNSLIPQSDRYISEVLKSQPSRVTLYNLIAGLSLEKGPLKVYY